MSMSRCLHVLLLPLAALVVHGCFTGADAQGLPCDLDDECGKGQSCIAGLCGPTGSEPCGNGLLNDDEECDEGEANADDGACTRACKLAVCGDGLVGPGEGCDGGSTDECTADCRAYAFADDMQGGTERWKHAIIDDPGCAGSFCLEDTWKVVTELPMNHPKGDASQRAWSTGDLTGYRGPGSLRLWTVDIDLTKSAPPIELGFTHYYQFKTDTFFKDFYVDGAIVEVSVDGGPFTQLPSTRYTGAVEDRGGCIALKYPTNPLTGLQAYVGGTTSWQVDKISLDEYAGHTISIGFRIGTDCGTYLNPIDNPMQRIVWFVDDVRVAAAPAP